VSSKWRATLTPDKARGPIAKCCHRFSHHRTISTNFNGRSLRSNVIGWVRFVTQGFKDYLSKVPRRIGLLKNKFSARWLSALILVSSTRQGWGVTIVVIEMICDMSWYQMCRHPQQIMKSKNLFCWSDPKKSVNRILFKTKARTKAGQFSWHPLVWYKFHNVVYGLWPPTVWSMWDNDYPTISQHFLLDLSLQPIQCMQAAFQLLSHQQGMVDWLGIYRISLFSDFFKSWRFQFPFQSNCTMYRELREGLDSGKSISNCEDKNIVRGQWHSVWTGEVTQFVVEAEAGCQFFISFVIQLFQFHIGEWEARLEQVGQADWRHRRSPEKPCWWDKGRERLFLIW